MPKAAVSYRTGEDDDDSHQQGRDNTAQYRVIAFSVAIYLWAMRARLPRNEMLLLVNRQAEHGVASVGALLPGHPDCARPPAASSVQREGLPYGLATFRDNHISGHAQVTAAIHVSCSTSEPSEVRAELVDLGVS